MRVESKTTDSGGVTTTYHIAIWWPKDLAYGGSTPVASMAAALAEAARHETLGYANGGGEIHIIKTIEEWIDVAILAFDGAWRAGHSPEAIAEAWLGKQTKNEARDWPDWRTMPPDRAIEHVRAK